MNCRKQRKEKTLLSQAHNITFELWKVEISKIIAYILQFGEQTKNFFVICSRKITGLRQKSRFFQCWAIQIKTFGAKESFYVCILRNMTHFQFVTNRQSFRNFYQKWTLGCCCGKSLKKKLKDYPTSRGKNQNILVLYAIHNENVASQLHNLPRIPPPQKKTLWCTFCRQKKP